MKIGIALSGGGSRGLAHLGLLKALEEENIKIEMITGSSAGAIGGALYCKGYSPDEILEIFVSTKLYHAVRFALSTTGLLNMNKTEDILHKHLPDDNFNTLKIPLVITAVDVKRGKVKYFYEGELVKPIIASASIPFIFDPVKVGEDIYVDGSILNNLPVEPLLGRCDKVIGSHCNPVGEDFEGGNIKSILERSIFMSINFNAYERKRYCDIFIEPPKLKNYKVFDFGRSREIFNIGYEYARENIHLFKDIDADNVQQEPGNQ